MAIHGCDRARALCDSGSPITQELSKAIKCSAQSQDAVDSTQRVSYPSAFAIYLFGD